MPAYTTTQKRHEELVARGYYFIRLYHPWGSTETYRHKETGALLFIEGGKEYSPAEFHEYLKENWEPPNEDGVTWKMHHMEGYFQEVGHGYF